MVSRYRVFESSKAKNETVDEPNNATFKNPLAPTITEEDDKYLPTKHEFYTHIQRLVFIGKHGDICFSTTQF